MRPGRRNVMIATSAFGLGIDKRDFRYVVHFQTPASVEQYVQEAGRGGRDGKKANCILLHDPADRSIHEALLSRSRIRPEQLYKLGKALAAWAHEEKVPSLQALVAAGHELPLVITNPDRRRGRSGRPRRSTPAPGSCRAREAARGGRAPVRRRRRA